MARVAFLNRIDKKHHDLAKKIAETTGMVYVPKQDFDKNGFAFFFYDEGLNKKDLTKKPVAMKGFTFNRKADGSYFVKSGKKDE